MAVELPVGVRRRVVELAADWLGAMPAEAVPASLRSIARFAPARRARLGATPIAAVLEADEEFRAAVAGRVSEVFPEVATALHAGLPLPAADPSDVAAVAYLLRSEGWGERVEQAARTERDEREAQASEVSHRAGDRARRRAEESQAAAGEQVKGLRRRIEGVQRDLDRERGRVREATELARLAEAELAAERERCAAEAVVAAREAAASRASVKRLTEQVEELEAALARARQDSRSAKEAVDERRWLLLDTLARSVKGLRDELSIPPPSQRPADRVQAVASGGEVGPATVIGDDPRSVDLLLTLPNAHLVVDGYNVTKTGYPDLALSDQRARLVAGLAALGARTGAEVTCVFDGAEVMASVPTTGQRGVRVLFSPPGEIADELIRRLVRAEPPGRPIAVCSADREVIDGVRRSGARTITPAALLARLARS